MLEHAPRFDSSAAQKIAREQFGIDGSARPLTSERDQNFLIETPQGVRYVLKVANASEPRAMLDAQQSVLRHLSETLDVVPRVVPAGSGEMLVEVPGRGDRTHFAWMVTFLPGSLLASVRCRSPELLETLGGVIGTMTASLQSYDHHAAHRDFHWDLAHGPRIIDAHRALLPGELRETIDTVLACYAEHTAPVLARLRRSVVHNDLNDHNVLVGDDSTISGIVDFGDMVYSYTIADVAIAAAYACLASDNPLAVIASIVRGYHAVFPATDDEIDALFGLICLRLATSACVAAKQREASPENVYLDVSQAGIRRVLPLLSRIPPRLAAAVFREACGLEPVPSSGRVREWLAANTARFAPVIDVDLRHETGTVLDLSVGSPLVSGDPTENTEPGLTRRIAKLLVAHGTRVAVGRYDEPRLLYTAPFFANGSRLDEERRTIHIGLDLFADAGTPVFAPLDGVVHAFAENRELQDYGPVIVLRHVTDGGDAFFTLYGHLSRESLDGMFVGRQVAQGDQIASFGAPEVNVGWTPHLHLQVITDDLGLGTDFPGVAPASQRAAWRSLSPDPNLIVGIPLARFPRAPSSKAEALARRRRVFAGNLSVAYRDPVRVVRGWRQHLYDDDGRRYLDAYNNVPHVGHSHPRIVRAVAGQMSVLNTNTRYLSDGGADYAERLLDTLPRSLEVCVLLSSASEANELALRMARAYTGSRDMIVLEAAYHGNTSTLIDISPYKHAGPGGSGAPDWVHVAPLPDDYRGAYRRDDADAGLKYAGTVASIIRELRENGRALAGFIAETCPSVGGQLMLPPGYLAEVYRLVRAGGGVCIADEVQTGLGRMGTHFWAFDAHGVTPDIVVMGKPLGNGHPLAAVATTRVIADAFDNGMEFFSTFGGNNVSAAAGLAVLDVLRDEGLQSHALKTGEQMLTGLRKLMRRHAIVGDVRGSGLFLGVELVRDRATLEPAGAEASLVANRMRERGILLGTDGPHHNVVKIRPPMPFDGSDADRLVETLDVVLREAFS